MKKKIFIKNDYKQVPLTLLIEIRLNSSKI